ncbi:DNA-directed RNA polymerase RPB1 [Pithovirus sibericum]|uniref:DNA-directed RNA polymerase n=1 Tax=Pithovirus sibericum TaxID=1450746 RepID=W5S5Z3_9VIRU|nr:DNA-directed RNA polymerase RPB1 [Pithovirus sibericum]AHH01717.1 DNA-directed RNA polymerase RPB1 [Pithovirus sibericum]
MEQVAQVENVELAPRYLTEDEVSDILSVLVVGKTGGASREGVGVLAPAYEAASIATESIREKLRRDLSKIVITPLGIPDLKDEIRRQFGKSRVAPGTPVGFSVAEAIGGPSTQMTLNAFHSAGSAGSGQGIERIQQMIDLTKKPKMTICLVHFKERLTYETAYLVKRTSIIGVTAGNLISDFEVDTPENLMFDRPWWYDLYSEVYGPIPEARYILRLTLNPKTMLTFQLTMEEVVAAIEKGNSSSVKCVFSPLSEGLIDVYPIEEVIVSKLKEKDVIHQANASNIFLTSIVQPNLDNIHVKGIPGARAAYPVSTPVLSIHEEDIPYPGAPGIWLVRLSASRISATGVTKLMMTQLLAMCGLPEVADTHSPIYIAVRSEEAPKQVINAVLAGNRRFETEEEKAHFTAIVDASQLYFLQVEGATLGKILERRDVNPVLTSSNNIHEIYQVLGVEAARKFYIREFYEMFSAQGLYIDPRHLELLADYVCNMGILNPVSATGINRQPIGALAQASYRKPLDVLLKAAARGALEKTSSVSTSIYIGQEARIGVGYSETFLDKEKEQRILRELGRAPTAQFDASSLNDAVGELDNITFGSRQITLGNQEMEAMFSQGNFAPPLTPSSLGTGLITPTASIPGPQVSKMTITPPSIPLPTTVVDNLVPAPIVSNFLVQMADNIGTVPCEKEQPTGLEIGPVGSTPTSTISVPADFSTPTATVAAIGSAQTTVPNLVPIPSSGSLFTVPRPQFVAQEVTEINPEDLFAQLSQM